LHPNGLTLCDGAPERLKLNEPIAKVNNGISIRRWDSVHAKVRSPELAHTARVDPLSAAVLSRAKDRDMSSGSRKSMVKDRAPPLVWTPPLEHLRIVERYAP
jgi:hypothetical protein